MAVLIVIRIKAQNCCRAEKCQTESIYRDGYVPMPRPEVRCIPIRGAERAVFRNPPCFLAGGVGASEGRKLADTSAWRIMLHTGGGGARVEGRPRFSESHRMEPC